jgi:hypothetical protein
MSKQSLAEILAEQLDQIDEIGGSERHQLAQVIGRDAYDAMLSKPKTAAVIDRWLDATGKAKGAATKALSIAIARVADKPQLVARIHREISDSFDETSPDAGSNPDLARRAQTPAKAKNGAVARGGQGENSIHLAKLAGKADLAEYMKARQNSRH